MLYNYGAILDFNPLSMKRVADYFLSKRDSLYSSLEPIESKYNEIQDEFDIFHPNVSFSIGDYPFDKDDHSIDLGTNISILANNTSSSFESSGETYTVEDNTVLVASSVEDGKQYLNNMFLQRESINQSVYWYYDLGSDDLTFPIGHVFNDSDILPATVASGIFYQKRYEIFDDFRVISHDVTNPLSIVSKSVLEREFNNIQDINIICNPILMTGNSISIDGDTVNLLKDSHIEVNSLSFDNLYSIMDMSPVPTEYGYENFGINDLSNFLSFNVVPGIFENREDKEVITSDNFDTANENTLEIDADSIDDEYQIMTTGGVNASNFHDLYTTLTEKLNSFYATQLKLFLNGYTNSGALGELLKYISEKIEEISGKFVLIDECDLLPADNVDEGCVMECDTISFDESNLMVTKQKLKSMIRCSALTCGRSI